MKWSIPPLIKVYEALGTIGDRRIEVNGNSAKIYSSSRGKFYSVTYEPAFAAIMVNRLCPVPLLANLFGKGWESDNASYYKGYLGYPAIAFLMMKGELEFWEVYARALAGIAWKDLNQKDHNDFEKTIAHVDEMLVKKGINVVECK